jgi:hypothetical protein
VLCDKQQLQPFAEALTRGAFPIALLITANSATAPFFAFSSSAKTLREKQRSDGFSNKSESHCGNGKGGAFVSSGASERRESRRKKISAVLRLERGAYANPLGARANLRVSSSARTKIDC